MGMSCNIYGLGIHINVPLQALGGLPPATKIDVFIAIGNNPVGFRANHNFGADEFYVSSEYDENGIPEFRASRSRFCGGVRIAYSDGAIFDLDHKGENMSVHVPPEMEIDDIAPSLLGPMLGVLLRLRGISCLHASAAVIDDLAIAFVGPSGAGKSTTAAAFARRGHSILTDDVLALTDHHERFFARPAYPRIRLWPNSAAGLFGSADALPRMMAGWDKRFLNLHQSGYRFQEQSLPLMALYFLAPRSSCNRVVTVEAMSPAEALMTLVADSFATNFQTKTQRAAEFEMLSRLVQTISLRRVTALDDFERMDNLYHAIVQDVRNLPDVAEIVTPQRLERIFH